MWVTWLLLACASGDESVCGSDSRALSLDEPLQDEGDEGETTSFTPADLVEPLAAPQTVEALGVGGTVVPVTVSAGADSADATLTGDPSDQGCAATLRVPVTLTLASDDGTFLVTGLTSIEVDLQAGPYWRTLALTLDADDVVPAPLHTEPSEANLAITWAEGVLDQIELWQVTADSRELSLVFDQ